MKKKMPVLLTFDVDGEALWLCRDPENIDRPVTLSLGQYGPNEGMPRILRVLNKYHLPATFFIPGMIAEKYPDMVKRVDAEGHEIGNHSWTHTYPDKMAGRAEEQDEYLRTSDLLAKLTGKRPAGYRSPAWEFSPHTLDLLEEQGFLYSSNMMDKDSVSHLQIGERKSKLVEIPIHWVLDDAAYWLYSVRIPGKAMQPLQAVEDYWKAEFDGLYEEYMETEDTDICYVLTCHPQVIGRPARMKVLENVIRHILGHADVEFMTCSSLAERFLSKSAAK